MRGSRKFRLIQRIVGVSLSTTEVDKILEELVARDVLKRSSHSYQIQVGLFKEWLCR